MDFQINALDHRDFEPLFAMSDAQLAERLAVRRTATSRPGFPCRVSLVDAEPGESLILVNFTHHGAASPFRASHAVYVRQGARQAHPQVNEVPELLRLRRLSLRAFDDAGIMVGAELCEGAQVEAPLRKLLAQPQVESVHIHYAAPGCFAASAVRAGGRAA